MITKKTTNCLKKRPVSSKILKEATEADLFKNGKATKEDGKIVKELEIHELAIPDGVTEIEPFAFHKCYSLKRVMIPDSVKRIGRFAFGDCQLLNDIKIGNGVTNIENSAFHFCLALENISLGDSVEEIGPFAFQSCEHLKNITLPSSVRSIGKFAFYKCRRLVSVTIGNNISTIGKLAFGDCWNLKEVIFQGKTLNEIQSMTDYPWGAEFSPDMGIIVPGKDSSRASLEESLISKWRKLYLKSI